MSLSVEVEEEGVMLGELWLAAPLLGDAVPSFESFFLEDLLESFPRESCSRAGISVRPTFRLGGRGWGCMLLGAHPGVTAI